MPRDRPTTLPLFDGLDAPRGRRPRPARFNGAAYVPSRDDARLSVQYGRIFTLMRDGVWRTLAEIAHVTGDPPASVSAQLRHMRKVRFGAHTVHRRPRLTRGTYTGLYEYQVIVAVDA